MDLWPQLIRRFARYPLCFCLGFFLAWPCAAQADKDPMVPQNVQRGKALFQRNCAMCHGADATGGIGPNLTESPLLREPNMLYGVAAAVIHDGRVEKGMPAFPQLTQADISDIIAFLNARIEFIDRSGAGASLKRLLTGNAAAGKEYFNGAGGCAKCHSPTGNLAGIGKKYPPAALEASFLYPRHDDVTAIVSLPSGKKVKGTLLHLDHFYIAILNQDGGYRSWPLQDVKVQVEDPLAAHRELLHKYTDKDIHNVFAYLETLK